jgi:hypothetical protein
MVYDQTLIVFCLPQYYGWALMSSRIHEAWAEFFGATFKDDPRYNVEDCFEPFPFPQHTSGDEHIEGLGRECYEYRAELMQRGSEGLTRTYNRLHDPLEDDESIIRLRELHDRIDRAILDAYGWTDVQPKCEFIPEFDDEEDEDENGRPRRKKYRYRWPDDVRDDVLARLLELNRKCALQEGQLPTEPPVLVEAANSAMPKANGRKKHGRKPSEDLNLSLLSHEKEEA